MSDESKEQTSRRLPIWALGPREEKEARQNLKKFAYGQCSEYVKAMVECSKLHGLKVFPACESQRNQMKECILSFQGEAYVDQERDKMVQRRIQQLEDQLKQQQQQQREQKGQN
ncbi:LAME_0A04610g1_1 [Lachancea meyersii CBS 8951]|uniref:COX assembly mitochondrial protein n=1 Tax=Lachancea meyersii CBS 8951 TaxID=1266667 RepID=A0A1G4IP73_9SACH|nr:LAME_0A04610g1_1 [Lachancea meyersii CBS 8951]